MNAVLEFAKENGYDDIAELDKWRGYNVYEPLFAGEGTNYVGLPYVILAKDGVIRMSTDEESLARIDELK